MFDVERVSQVAKRRREAYEEKLKAQAAAEEAKHVFERADQEFRYLRNELWRCVGDYLKENQEFLIEVENMPFFLRTFEFYILMENGLEFEIKGSIYGDESFMLEEILCINIFSCIWNRYDYDFQYMSSPINGHQIAFKYVSLTDGSTKTYFLI